MTPKELKLINFNDSEELSPAYLYQITLDKPGKNKYLGWHKCDIEGEVDLTKYMHTSLDKQFKEDIYKYGGVYEVIAVGETYNMAYMEIRDLTKVNAKSNPEWYNMSNGGGFHLHKNSRINLIDLIINDLKAFKYLVEPTDIADFLGDTPKYTRYQVRDKVGVDPAHAIDLYDQILDLNGDVSSWEPIVLLEGIMPDGGTALGDGNHFVHVTGKLSKKQHVSKLPTQMLPKAVWSMLTKSQLRMLLKGLNPRQTKPSLPTSDSEAISEIANRYFADDIPVKSESNIEWLLILGFGMTKITNKRGLLVKAQEQVNLTKTITPDEQQCDYTAGDGKKNLVAKLAKENGIPAKYAHSISSSWMKWDTIMGTDLPFLLDPLITVWKTYVYHTKLEYKNKWESIDCPANTKVVANFVDLINAGRINAARGTKNTQPDLLRHEFVHLAFTQKNPLLDI